MAYLDLPKENGIQKSARIVVKNEKKKQQQYEKTITDLRREL